jgi:capsular polysaccharide biosynthesis protein
MTGKRTNPPTRLVAPDRPKVTLTEAIRRYPTLVILPIGVLLVLALIVGFARPSTYTSEAKLAVGRIDVATQAAPGVVSASQSLASAYSRAIGADQVTKQIESEFGSGGEVAASPIPESPVILVEGKDSSESAAIELANSASKALISYVNELNSNARESQRLLKEYETAQAEVLTLESEIAAETTGANAAQQAELNADKLKLKSLEAGYRGTIEEDTSGNDLRILTTAQSASSDRNSVLKLLLFAALVAGAAIGVLLAYRRAVAQAAKPAGRKVRA